MEKYIYVLAIDDSWNEVGWPVGVTTDFAIAKAWTKRKLEDSQEPSVSCVPIITDIGELDNMRKTFVWDNVSDKWVGDEGPSVPA